MTYSYGQGDFAQKKQSRQFKMELHVDIKEYEDDKENS